MKIVKAEIKKKMYMFTLKRLTQDDSGDIIQSKVEWLSG